MIVKLNQAASRFPDLTPGQPYLVIGLEAGDLRLLNDQGKPFLYPAQVFSVVDPREPADWVTDLGEDDERYAYPPPLNPPGFFEDFFAGIPEAVATFWRVMNQRLVAAA